MTGHISWKLYHVDGKFYRYLPLYFSYVVYETQPNMPHNYDVNWALIKEWIIEVAAEYISETCQDEFVTLVSRLAHDHFEDRYLYLQTGEYQCYVVACMYVVGCLACHHPFDLETMCALCDGCYTHDMINQTIYRLVCWMSPTSDRSFCRSKILDRRTVASSEGTVCDLVVHVSFNCPLIRKRIKHWTGLPAIDAMVEAVVHYLLPKTPNVARLVHIHANDQHTDLYYEYVPTPLSDFFGTEDMHSMRTILVGLLHGVRDLHLIGIAHRDLKGQNIHVTDNERCKLLDVGSAGYGLIRHTVPVCTITHRSPDILQAEVDHRPYHYDGKCLDIWSVGVLILELYLGPHPFGRTRHAESAGSMLDRIDRLKASVLTNVQPMCTPNQLMILSRCLDSIPENRPNIDEVLEVFES